jgi:hypothetical protein
MQPDAAVRTEFQSQLDAVAERQVLPDADAAVRQFRQRIEFRNAVDPAAERMAATMPAERVSEREQATKVKAALQ